MSLHVAHIFPSLPLPPTHTNPLHYTLHPTPTFPTHSPTPLLRYSPFPLPFHPTSHSRASTSPRVTWTACWCASATRACLCARPWWASSKTCCCVSQTTPDTGTRERERERGKEGEREGRGRDREGRREREGGLEGRERGLEGEVNARAWVDKAGYTPVVCIFVSHPSHVSWSCAHFFAHPSTLLPFTSTSTSPPLSPSPAPCA